MRGAVVRLFGADDVERLTGTGPLDFGLAYCNSGTLPDRRLATTDFSGSTMAANVPVTTEPRIAVVVEGTPTFSSARRVVGCAEVRVETNAATVVTIGPYRADHPAGSLCLAHAP